MPGMLIMKEMDLIELHQLLSLYSREAIPEGSPKNDRKPTELCELLPARRRRRFYGAGSAGRCN